ncbi:GntR family transcriptional regulator [Alteribacter lacisalsi]|uniref:GntR family transcriptional regulator n=1 Tax=Alteribacter lacisalsi TaxID=2045244 RepID=A0A2W0HD84_9BACI|nr:GntR family transcriptional regulator [Alteribacter lacisalsi]PYZ99167.1 GntR family transcriptional regulator [Alteribacter lacisalsi]
MTFDHNRPIYLQLMEQIYGDICSGELLPGSKLPSVREMAVSAGVNPNTVSRTYMEMERKGVVESRRGQGTFVTGNSSVIRNLKKSAAGKETKRLIDVLHRYGYSREEMIALVEAELNRKGEPDT